MVLRYYNYNYNYNYNYRYYIDHMGRCCVFLVNQKLITVILQSSNKVEGKSLEDDTRNIERFHNYGKITLGKPWETLGKWWFNGILRDVPSGDLT